MNTKESKLQRLLLISATATWLVAGSASADLTFNFTEDVACGPVDQATLDAFAEAGALWSDIFVDNVTVIIRVGFCNFSDPTNPAPDNAIASASPYFFLAPYAEVVNSLTADASSAADLEKLTMLQPLPDYDLVVNQTPENPNGAGSLIPYRDSETPGAISNDLVSATSANLKALGLMDPTTGEDGYIKMNSNSVLNWDLDRSDGITGKDFIGSVSHEIGHILGFESDVDYHESRLDPQSGLAEDEWTAAIMDLFRFADDFGIGIPDVSIDAGTEYFPLLGGGQVPFCNGRTIDCQASHWADNLGLGLMDPTLTSNQINSISVADIEMLDVIGWTLAPVELVTFDFTGYVSEVYEPLAGTFSIGDPISGSYTFDPSTYDISGSPDFGSYIGVTQFDALFGSYLASANGGNINVTDGLDGKDEYHVIAKPPNLVAAPVGGLEISMLLLELTDETMSAFSSDSLPTFVDLANFGTVRVVLRFGESPDYSFVVATLDNLIPANYAEFVQGECGQTIYESVTLTQSIGPCPGDGIVIGANNIILEADGHTISGTGTGDGIQIFGRSNVVLRHAFISGFDIGVHVLGGDGVRIEESQLSGNNRGTVVETNGYHIVTRNVIRDNGVGVVLNAPNNFVYHNVIFNNAQQIQDTGGNFWVDPGAGLGNYWSNYWGDDDGSGGRLKGDFIGDTRLPHEGVDTSPLLNPSIITNFGPLMCDDWWGSYTAYLIWRGGWSPVTIRITDNQGRVLSKDINELGKDGFYAEDDSVVPGSTLVQALILPCTKNHPVDGTYTFEMTAQDDLDYSMEWYVGTQGGGVQLYRSVENVGMAAGEKQEVVTQLVTLDDQGQGNFTFAADALVDIDVKPGDATNAVNLRSAGVIPVAILSSPTFDATTVMPDSVAMSGAAVKLVGKGTNYLCSASDENGDGLDDLMCKIETAQMLLEPGETTAVVTAKTVDGLSIRGTDSLTIVKDAM